LFGKKGASTSELVLAERETYDDNEDHGDHVNDPNYYIKKEVSTCFL
jgi:hypothetical protein